MSELLFTEFIESLIKVTVLPTSVRLSDGAITDLFLMTAARRAASTELHWEATGSTPGPGTDLASALFE